MAKDIATETSGVEEPKIESDDFDPPETILKLTREKQHSADYPTWEGPLEDLVNKVKIIDVTDEVYQCKKDSKLRKNISHETVDETVPKYSSREYRDLPVSDPEGFPERTDYYSTDKSRHACKKCAGKPPVCKKCNGSRKIECSECREGRVSVEQECSVCSGNSKEIKEPCSRCGGKGIETVTQDCLTCDGRNVVGCTCIRGRYCRRCEGYGTRVQHRLITATYAVDTHLEHSPYKPPLIDPEPTRLWNVEQEWINENPDQGDKYIRQRLTDYSIPVRIVTYEYSGREYYTVQSGGIIRFESAPTKTTTKEDLRDSPQKLVDYFTIRQTGIGILALGGYVLFLTATLALENRILQFGFGLATLGMVSYTARRPSQTIPGAIIWVVIASITIFSNSGASIEGMVELAALSGTICLPAGIAFVGTRIDRDLPDLSSFHSLFRDRQKD